MPLLQIRIQLGDNDIGKIGLHVGYISIGHQHPKLVANSYGKKIKSEFRIFPDFILVYNTFTICHIRI